MASYYINEDGTLADDKIVEDLHKAIKMYENGEIMETHDVLVYISNAIRQFGNELDSQEITEREDI